jgi:hypothetical protein
MMGEALLGDMMMIQKTKLVEWLGASTWLSEVLRTRTSVGGPNTLGGSVTLTISPLSLRMKSRLLKSMVILWAQAARGQPLETSRRCQKRARPLPCAPTINVSNQHRWVNFCLRVLDLDGVLIGHKIYTGLGRMSLLPVFGGSCYWHLVADCL